MRFWLALLAASLLATAALGQAIPEEVFKEYRLALLKEAGRTSTYPKDALELGIEGTVVVRLSVDANGRIKSSTIDPSSGYVVLDSAALEMVRNAHPHVSLPQALRGRSFDVAVPVTFRIRQERGTKP